MRKVQTGNHSYKWVRDADEVVSDWASNLILASLGIVLIVGLVWFGYLAEDHFFGYHPTFTLRADEWDCAHKQSETTYIGQLVGKSVVMIPITTSYCTDYHRKG